MKEQEIRPKAIFDKYLEISKKDIEVFFSDHDGFVDIDCPACYSENIMDSFTKYNFTYVRCNDCFTLFTSPRPTNEMIAKFYKNSLSSKFWAEIFFPKTELARREKIFKPRVELLNKFIGKLKIPEPKVLIDIGAGFGIFLEELNKMNFFDETYGIEPSIDLADACRKKGINVIEKAIEDIVIGSISYLRWDGNLNSLLIF